MGIIGAAGSLSGCATLTSTSVSTRGTADSIALTAGFVKRFNAAGPFMLCSYSRISNPGEPLTVYIEGDGLAWKGRHQISDDPTPLHPMVLQMAAMDPSSNVMYLARPGQYVEGKPADVVDPGYWTDRRFSEEVITAMDTVIQKFVAEARTSRVDLVGYSGGGAVAVLVAGRRKDVGSIRTIGGNLDPSEVNRRHHVSPLSPGPDPLEVAPMVSAIPQRHFVGTNDTVVPSDIAERFKGASKGSDCVRITRVPGATHQSGWLESWQRLRALPVECGNSD